MQSKTNETTQAILNWFYEHGIFAKRHGVSAGRADYTNKAGETKSRYFSAGIIGGSDVFVWLPPNCTFLGVEVKTGADRLRPEQIGFGKNIERMGGKVLVVKDLNDFILQISTVLPLT